MVQCFDVMQLFGSYISWFALFTYCSPFNPSQFCMHFSAVTEDATRAIELKNGLSVGGRKIGVKHAMQRATLEQRRSKENKG